MIKPYIIKEIREDDVGIGVTFSVEIAYMEPLGINNNRVMSSATSFIYVPKGEDVDSYLYNYLYNSGWIAE
jgi:hypothetical protein